MPEHSLNDFLPPNNPVQINESIPNIFVICLTAYNNRLLHGTWINATQEVHTIRKEINRMLLESPASGAEHFKIHAFEGFGSLKIDEFESIDCIQRMAVFISEMGGELGIKLLEYCGDVESAQATWENNYHGAYENELEFAIQLFDELYMPLIPETAQGYIDYASFKKDIFIEDYFPIIVGGESHIFSRSGYNGRVV